MDSMLEHEKACVDVVSEETKYEAAEFLRNEFSIIDKQSFRKLIENGSDRWWYSKYHTLGGGMTIRNLLRDNGFGEKDLPIENLDYIYVELIERAVMGHEIDWEKEKDNG